MNKIAKSLCMMAVVALAFTSCTKNEENAKSFTFNRETEQFAQVNENGDFERMYLDANFTNQFEENDVFAMYRITTAGDASSAKYRLNASGQLEPVDPMSNITTTLSDGSYYSFYPGNSAVGFNVNNYMGRFRLDATQIYRPEINNVPQMPETAVYQAAKVTTNTRINMDDAFFSFKNIMGAMALRLYSPAGQVVTSIAVTDHKFNLVGDVNLNIEEVDPVYMTTLFRNYDESDAAYMAELAEYLGPNHLNYSVEPGAGNTVTLDCGTGVALGATAADATCFYIVLRPLAVLQGCEIVITFDDNTTKTITTNQDYRIKPNIIQNFSPINVD